MKEDLIDLYIIQDRIATALNFTDDSLSGLEIMENDENWSKMLKNLGNSLGVMYRYISSKIEESETGKDKSTNNPIGNFLEQMLDAMKDAQSKVKSKSKGSDLVEQIRELLSSGKTIEELEGMEVGGHIIRTIKLEE